MLSQVDGETEAIRIAQGKYKLATKWKDMWTEAQRNLRWDSI